MALQRSVFEGIHMMQFEQPSEDQLIELADELDGLEETWGNSLNVALENLNLSPDLKYSVIFIDNLENHIFLCEECDCWKRTEIRVYNEIADKKMCEDCDESY